jgi:nitrite reductase/ring-hydroxylating ferredoxin subunit
MPEKLTTLCAVADAVPVRDERQGTAFAVFRVGGHSYVTHDDCTHGPGSMVDGQVCIDVNAGRAESE